MSSNFDRGKFVIGIGPTPAQVFEAGRNPGEQESRIGLPFVGKAGAERAMYHLRADLQLADYYTTNLFKYWTFDDAPPDEANYDSHWPVFVRELAVVQPSILVTFGADCSEYIFKKCGLPWLDLERQHGIPFAATLDIQEGLSADCDRELPEDDTGLDWLMNLMSIAPETSEPLELTLFPCLHPAAGIHSPSSMSLIYTDFLALSKLLRGQLPLRDDSRAVVAPAIGILSDVSDVESSFQADSLVMGLDTEGQSSRPWGLTYSFQPHTGYCILSHSREALVAFTCCLESFAARGGTIVVHNMLWDLDVLAAMGIHLPERSCLDSMIGLYLLGREPQGLKAASYRHLGVMMKAYSDVIQPYSDKYAKLYLEAAASIDWGVCPKCGAASAVNTEHPLGGVENLPKEWLRKDGQTLRSKFSGMVEICDGGLAEHGEMVLDKKGNARWKRVLSINQRIQRALKNFYSKEGASDAAEAIDVETGGEVW